MLSPEAVLNEEREVIKPLLKAGYLEQLTRRPPFNKEIAEAGSPEGAYSFSLEQKYIPVPEALRYEKLQSNIDPFHRQRIAKIWQKVREAKDRWQKAALALENKWQSPPHLEEEFPSRVSQAIGKIRKNYQRAASALVFPLPANDQTNSEDDVPSSTVLSLSPLENWKEEEKGLRTSYYNADKNYFLAIRLYYEMLLEKSPANDNVARPPVLPLDFEGRKEIVKNNRYLRLIDAMHQAATIAKAGHHEQEKRRIRKTEDVPYWFHPLKVMEMYALDVVPFIIENDQLTLDFIVGVAASACHDLAEDTKFTPEGVVEFISARADKIDSTIAQVIESGFGVKAEELGEKVLALFKVKVRQRLRAILRVVSKNTPLTKEEQEEALQQNIAGRKNTLDILGLDQDELPFEYPAQFAQPSKTFRQFPDDGDDKLNAFLVRLNVLTTGDRRRQALLVKLLDRTDNLRTLQYIEPISGDIDGSLRQRKTLRSTVTRLIAWAMLDHDKENLPLYNALPRLIDMTLSEYRRFQTQFPGRVETNDQRYINQLEQWQSQVLRYSLPAEAQKSVDEYNLARAA